jgi:hypothetical protein
VRPAERKLDVAALGELAAAGIAVDLQDPLKPSRWAIGRSALRRVHRHRRARRIGAAPWPVVSGIGPELAGLGAAAAGSSTGIVVSSANSFDLWAELDKQTRMQRTQVPGGLSHPVRQCRTIEIDPWRP